MPFLKILFLVPYIKLLEIHLCDLWKILDSPTCLIQMEIYLVCKILKTFQIPDLMDSVL